MNKRIAEIIEECGIHIDPLNIEASWREVEFLCEKIVEECISVAIKSSNIDSKHEAWYAIEEHFGIKNEESN